MLGLITIWPIPILVSLNGYVQKCTLQELQRRPRLVRTRVKSTAVEQACKFIRQNPAQQLCVSTQVNMVLNVHKNCKAYQGRVLGDLGGGERHE